MVDDPRAPLDLRPFDLLRDGWVFVQPHYFTLLTVFALLVVLAAVLVHLPVVGFLVLFFALATGNSGVCWYLMRAYQGRDPSLATLLEPMQEQPAQVLLLHLTAGVCLAVGASVSWVLGPLLGGLLLGVPAICINLLLWVTLPEMLLDRVSVMVAARHAWRIVQPQAGDFVLFAVGVVVLNLVAAVTLLGALFCVPATCGALTLLSARALRIGQVVQA